MSEEGNKPARKPLYERDFSGRLLSTTDCAKVFNVDPATIRKWAKQGRIPSVRLPSGTIRIPGEAINAVLRSGKPEGENEGENEQ